MFPLWRRACMHHGLESAARQYPGHPAVLAGERPLDIRRARSGAATPSARHLVAQGVGPGDRLAVMTSNRPEFVVCRPGRQQARCGAGAAELRLEGARGGDGAGADRTASTRWPTGRRGPAVGAPGCRPGCSTSTTTPGRPRSPTAPARHRGRSRPVDEDDDAVLVFSSGTTDCPKAVRHTHRSIALATAHWCLALGLGHEDRFQVATPPSHILGPAQPAGRGRRGCHRAPAPPLRSRRGAPCHRGRPHDPGDGRRAHRPGAGQPPRPRGLRPLVPPLHHVGGHAGHGGGGRGGDGAHGRAVAARVRDERGAGDRRQPGRRPGGLAARLRRAARRRRRAARRGPRVAARSSPPGETGEIEVRSASAMAGYLPEEATAAAFDDGWYRTGDVGWLEPDGWVHLTDRCKEMIKVSGFQVAPAEIEAVLHGHPAVLDCAVFGVADERAGEVPVAAVQLEPGSAVGEEELQALVGEALATYKHLRRVVVVDAIPRTPSGKVLRRTLRDEWAPARTRGDRGGGLSGRPPLARAGGPARRGGTGGRPAGPARGGRARRRERAPPSSTPRSTASGWRELRAAVGRRAPRGLGGRGRRRRRGAGPRAGRRRLRGTDAGGRAAPRRPAPRRAPAARPSCSATTCRAWPRDGTARWRTRESALDAKDAARALVLVPGADGHRARRRSSRRTPPGGARPDPAGAALPGRAGRARCSRADPRRSARTTSPAGTALGLAATCADLVGVMRGALALAADYARTRRQYGAPIGSFQAVQHLLADALVAMEGSRSIALHAAWAVDALPGTDALAAASAAKAYCARAARARVRDGDPGARRHRQHVGVPGPRVPAPGAALGRGPRRRRGQPGPRARRPRRRRRRWTSVTRPRSAPSGCGCAPGWPPTTPACRRRRPTDEYWAGQAAWHQTLYDAGFFGLSWPEEVGGHGLPERLRRHPRRGAHRGRRAAAPERRLSGAGAARARQRGRAAALPARDWSAAASAGARGSASPTPARTWRRCARGRSPTATST